jgi:hypothetical protein
MTVNEMIDWIPAIAGWTFLVTVFIGCFVAIFFLMINEEDNGW